MKQNLSKRADTTVVAATVARLSYRDEFSILPEPFAALLKARGIPAAEDTIFAALEDLALRIDRLRDDWVACRFDQITPSAQRTARIADEVGFASVARAARACATAAHTENTVAICATLDRLDRAFDSLVSQIWDFLDRI